MTIQIPGYGILKDVFFPLNEWQKPVCSSNSLKYYKKKLKNNQA